MEPIRNPAGVLAPPPLLFLAAWMTGVELQRVVALEYVSSRVARRRLFGGALIAAGAILSALVVRRFGQASTPVSPMRPSRALVTGGIFQHTRNPDYLGQALIYVGASILANRPWPMLLLPATLALVTLTVVRREERYLERRFGMAYRVYSRQVPRWL